MTTTRGIAANVQHEPLRLTRQALQLWKTPASINYTPVIFVQHLSRVVATFMTTTC